MAPLPSGSGCLSLTDYSDRIVQDSHLVPSCRTVTTHGSTTKFGLSIKLFVLINIIE